MCHVLESVKHRRIADLAPKMLRQEPPSDSRIHSESFAEYVAAIGNEYFPQDHSSTAVTAKSSEQFVETSSMRSTIWGEFARLCLQFFSVEG